MTPRLALFAAVLLGCGSDPGEPPKAIPVQADVSRPDSAAIAIASADPSAFRDSILQVYKEHPGDVLEKLRAEAHPDDVRAASALLARSEGEAKLPFVHYLVSQGDRSIPALLDVIEDEKDWATQVAAIQVLGKIGSPVPGPVIARQLQVESDWVRMAAAHALGEMGCETQALVEALDDSSDTVVSAVLIGIGKAGDDSALPACLPFLGHANPRVRAAAVSAVSRLGRASDAGSLEPLLADPDTGVRYKAQQGIDRLRTARTEESP